MTKMLWMGDDDMSRAINLFSHFSPAFIARETQQSFDWIISADVDVYDVQVWNESYEIRSSNCGRPQSMYQLNRTRRVVHRRSRSIDERESRLCISERSHREN